MARAAAESIAFQVNDVFEIIGANAGREIGRLFVDGDPSVQTQATRLITRLAKLTGAQPRPLSAPRVAQSREAKLVMVSDPDVRETMDLFSRITLAIIGIGAVVVVAPSRMLARSGYVFSSTELFEEAEAGAVGDMSLRFFDLDGKPVVTPLDGRVIGMRLEDLAKVERVPAPAGVLAKVAAIQESGLANTTWPISGNQRRPGPRNRPPG